MKTILVPFDFSEYSLAALRTAQRICDKSQARIVCVTVIPSEIDWDLLSDAAKEKYPQLIEERQEAIEILPGYIKSVAPAKAQIEQIVKIGVPHEQILRVAKHASADLIVIGAYGKGYKQGNFVGSNLQKVIRLANCPVLAVKSALDGNAFRKMAFATVFNPAGKVAFEKILPLAKLFKTSIHLLYVNTPDHFTNSSQSDKEMAEFGKGHEQFVIHRHIFNHKNVEDGIKEFCVKNEIRLIGVASGNRANSSAYIVGTTETLIFKSEFGILSVKA